METANEPSVAAPGLEHFIRLAKSGRHRGCSSGEHSARRLALCVIEHAGGLDDTALEGLCEFVRRAAMYPNLAQDLIGGR